MEELYLNNESFEETIKTSDLPVLIDFYASWCGPCQMMSPIVASIADTYGDRLIIGKVDIDENMELAKAYKIRNIPAFVIFANGQEQERKVGALSQVEIEQWVESHI